MKILVFCDGASKGNPGKSGWGVFLRQESGEEYEEWGGVASATNNQMELMAAIKGLKKAKKIGAGKGEILVATDSQYVQKGVSEWSKGWIKKGWKTASGEPVKNKELWQTLLAEAENLEVRWRWVKGHAGHPGNERADELANEGCRSQKEGERSRKSGEGLLD